MSTKKMKKDEALKLVKEHGYNYNLFSLEDAVQDYVNNYLVPDLRLGA